MNTNLAEQEAKENNTMKKVIFATVILLAFVTIVIASQKPEPISRINRNPRDR